MIPIEVRGKVLAVLFGCFQHAAVHYESQDYKRIQCAIETLQA
jgi:hypothetical protein